LRARAAAPHQPLKPEGGIALEPVDPSPHPGAVLMSKDDVARIEGAIAELPPSEREVVGLRIHGGLTFREIAEVMGCPLSTALGRMRNACMRLRRSLEGST
jgi:RNA polymerase sigma-70 factor (ECF subfamily)